MTLARKVVDDSLAQRVTFVRITVFFGEQYETVTTSEADGPDPGPGRPDYRRGYRRQLRPDRGQLIDTGIRNEVSATATGTSALIKEWIATRKSIVAAGVLTAQTAEDPLPAIIQVAKSGKFEAAYMGTPDKQMIQDHDMQLPAGYDPTARPWYKDNVNATSTVMTAAASK